MMKLGWVRFAAIYGVMAIGAYAEDVASRTFEFEYRASLEAVEGNAKMWIPIPLDTPHQIVKSQDIESNAQFRIVEEETYGNRFILLEREGGGIDVVISLQIERKVRSGVESADLTSEERNRYLRATAMVPIDGAVREEALRIAGDAQSNDDKARRLYDHIVDTVRYDKSGKGWGRGDAVYACDARAGNCTDFHSLFIGEARALGIPSRFLMGFSVPNDAASGEIGGYHGWAEFYSDKNGWMPLDASEAHKDKSRREALYGGLDADRVQFTIGRDLVLPEMEGEPVNFVIYPYVEVDGDVHPNVKRSFAYRNTE